METLHMCSQMQGGRVSFFSVSFFSRCVQAPGGYFSCKDAHKQF